MKVKDLPCEAFLVQDSQERRAVLEGAGLPPTVYEGEYPTLFVLVGDAEILKVWGITSFVPYLEERVETLYDKEVEA